MPQSWIGGLYLAFIELHSPITDDTNLTCQPAFLLARRLAMQIYLNLGAGTSGLF